MSGKIDGRDYWVRLFDVSYPKKHCKGFMVYKVSSTVFPKNFPDGATKITVWKRYNDFKNLHKELELLFKQLYLKGSFPQLPKDSFFERYDQTILEERKQCALQLLQFCAIHPQLFTSKIFVTFFESGFSPDDLVDSTSTEKPTSNSSHNNVFIEEEHDPLKHRKCLIPEKLWTADKEGSLSNDNPSTTVEQSVPQSSDGNSFENYEKTSKNVPTSTKMSTSKPSIVTFSGDTSSGTPSNFAVSGGLAKPYSMSDLDASVSGGIGLGLSASFDDISQLSPDEDTPFNFRSASFESLPTVEQSFSLIPKENSDIEVHHKDTNNSSNEISGFSSQEGVVPSYLLKAAGYFSIAQHHESNEDFSKALDAYMEGIHILLTGVKDDPDKTRKLLAKQKIEKYILMAEGVKSKIHPNASLESLSSSSEVEWEKSCEVIQRNVVPSSCDELAAFKIVGYFSKALIAVDHTAESPNCFVIKVLQKSPSPLEPEKPTIIPSSVPFMVNLIKWFNFENCVILVLQYAPGGGLKSFLRHFQSQLPIDICSEKPTFFTNPSAIVTNKENIGKTPPASPRNSSFSPLADISQLTPTCIVPTAKSSSPTEALDKLITCDTNTEELISHSKTLMRQVSVTLQKQKLKVLHDLAVTNYSISKINSQTCPYKEDCLEIPSANYCTNEFYSSEEITKLSSLFESDCNYQDFHEFEPLPSRRMIPECGIKVWAAELLIALDKLHKQGITYGTLCMNDVLLGYNGHILLSYKALWNEVDTKPVWNAYSAPEVRMKLAKSLWKMHPSIDWWSYGCILYFLLTGFDLTEIHPEGIHENTIIVVPNSNSCGEQISSSAKSLLLELLNYKPTLRLGYYGGEEIRSHPFFAGFDWDNVLSSVTA